MALLLDRARILSFETPPLRSADVEFPQAGQGLWAISTQGTAAKLTGRELAGRRLGSPETHGRKVEVSAEEARDLKLDPSGELALLIGARRLQIAAACPQPGVDGKAGPLSPDRNQLIDLPESLRLEDAAWLGSSALLISGWFKPKTGPERFVLSLVDLRPEREGLPYYRQLVSAALARKTPEQPGYFRVLVTSSAGRGGTLAWASRQIAVLQGVERYTREMPGSFEVKVTRRLNLPTSVLATALALSPSGDRVAVAGRYRGREDGAIWSVAIPAVSGSAEGTSLGAALWRGRRRIENLSLSTSGRWLAASGDGLLLFDLEAGKLVAATDDAEVVVSFQAGGSEAPRLAFLESGRRFGARDLDSEGLTLAGRDLPALVRKTTGLRVVAGELRIEPTPR